MPPVSSLAALITLSPEVVGSTLSIDTTVLPFTIQADTLSRPWVGGAEFFAGDKIVDANGNVQTATNHGFTGATVPVWSTAQGGFTPDGSVIWVYTGIPTTTRVEVLIYNQVFTFLASVHGFVTSPLLQAFTTFTGSVAIDPTVTETLLQIRGRNYDPSTGAVWQSGHNYAVNDQIVDSNGNVQTVIVAGLSGGTVPVWAIGI